MDGDDRFRQRSRSASLPNSRFSINSRSTPRANIDVKQYATPQIQSGVTRKSQRSTRSAVPVRKNAVRRKERIYIILFGYRDNL